MSCEKDIPKSLTKFTWNHLSRSLFFNKVQPVVSIFIKTRLQHIDFFGIWRNFKTHNFYKTSPGNCFWVKSVSCYELSIKRLGTLNRTKIAKN